MTVHFQNLRVLRISWCTKDKDVQERDKEKTHHSAWMHLPDYLTYKHSFTEINFVLPQKPCRDLVNQYQNRCQRVLPWLYQTSCFHCWEIALCLCLPSMFIYGWSTLCLEYRDKASSPVPSRQLHMLYWMLMRVRIWVFLSIYQYL